MRQPRRHYVLRFGSNLDVNNRALEAVIIHGSCNIVVGFRRFGSQRIVNCGPNQ